MKNKKANVLIVHNYYQIPGGEDTVVANEVKLLKENGHQVSFYSRNNSELAKFSKLKKMLLPITTIFNPRTYNEIKKTIREKKIEIVHVHNTLNLISPAVYYAAKRCKVPVVQTIHNFRLLCPAATFYRDGQICEDCVKKGLMCAVKHGCYRGSKVQTLACVIMTKIHRFLGIYRKLNYICLTEFNKNKLLEINSTKKKEFILPQKVYVKPNLSFENVGQSAETVEDYYLFVGRVERIKGIDLLIKAFSQIPEEKLLIAGQGTELEEYKEVVGHKKLKNIRFLGFQDREHVQLLMKKAKAIIVPSQWYEGFPMTIVEAFSVGTPVIGGDIGNVGSMIDEGINGWKFQYHSAEDLVKKINVCSKTNRKQLKVECPAVLLPEGNYNALCDIYDNAMKDEEK